MSMFTIEGGFTDLAVSSRVRLARNLKGYPFRLTEAQHTEIADKGFPPCKTTRPSGRSLKRNRSSPARPRQPSWSRST